MLGEGERMAHLFSKLASLRTPELAEAWVGNCEGLPEDERAKLLNLESPVLLPLKFRRLS